MTRFLAALDTPYCSMTFLDSLTVAVPLMVVVAIFMIIVYYSVKK